MSETLYRDIEIDHQRAKGEETYPASLSTQDDVVQRYFGGERLVHTADAVDLSRAADGLPLLFNHNTDEPIGLVENVRLEGGRLRGNLRFGHSQRAQDIQKDVEAGLMRGVSIGYHINKVERAEGDDDVFNVTDWSLLEASIAPVPASYQGVGIGRSLFSNTLTLRGNNMDTQNSDQNGAEGVKAERQRISQISSMAEQHRSGFEGKAGGLAQFDAHVRQCLEDGTSYEVFNAWLLGQVSENNQRARDIVTDSGFSVGMSKREIEQYSFLRAINIQADPKLAMHGGLELEASRAIADKLGRQPRGMFVPLDVLSTRDLAVGTPTAGGNLVGTHHDAGSFIQMLRNRTRVIQLGATVLSGLVQNVSIPRQTSAGTAYWVTEGNALTESQQSFDTVTLSPKSVGAYTDYTRQMTLQSTPDVEFLVRSDLASIIAIEIDRVAMYGSGTGAEPLGITNTTGINVTTFAAADPTYTEIIAMEAAIAADNADQGALGYLMDTTMRAALKTTVKDSGSGMFVWESTQAQDGAGQVNGFRAEVSNNVTDGDVVFADWSSLLIGEWGGLDLLVDPYTMSTSGGVRVVAFKDIDIAVRHPESFCVSNDGA